MAPIHPASLAEVAAFAVPALGAFARRGFSSNRRGIGDQQIVSSGLGANDLTLNGAALTLNGTQLTLNG